MDIGIVFRVHVPDFRMQRGIPFARKARITLVDLDERISLMEVGVVIISGEPGGSRIGDLIGLGREGLVLDKAAKWFCIAEHLGAGWRGPNAGAQFLFVITTGEVIDLSRSLIVDFLTQ
jgi:hypothetical protein